MHCECDHLTSFIGAIGSSYSRIATIYGSAGSLSSSGIAKVQVLLWLLFSIYLFAALFMFRGAVVMRVQQRRMAQRVWNSAVFQEYFESLKGMLENLDSLVDLDLKTAQEKARCYECGRVNALLSVQDETNVSFRRSMALYFEAMAHGHKLIAMFTNTAEPSFIRAPVALLDLITFLFAIALLEVQEQPNTCAALSLALTLFPPLLVLPITAGKTDLRPL